MHAAEMILYVQEFCLILYFAEYPMKALLEDWLISILPSFCEHLIVFHGSWAELQKNRCLVTRCAPICSSLPAVCSLVQPSVVLSPLLSPSLSVDSVWELHFPSFGVDVWDDINSSLISGRREIFTASVVLLVWLISSRQLLLALWSQMF